MIQNKLEIRYVMHSLNELEKLKLLLFDEDQYYLFEHIPKPYLIDGTVAKTFDDPKPPKPESNQEVILEVPEEAPPLVKRVTGLSRFKDRFMKKKVDKKVVAQKKKISKSDILMSNNTFWKKNINRDTKM